MAATVHVPDPAWEAWLRTHPLPGAALFGSRTIAELLGLLTMHPDRPYTVRDAIFQLGTNLESTQRAMERLVLSETVFEVRRGRQRHFVLRGGAQGMALRQVVLGTVTLAPRLRWAADVLGEDAVTAAFVYGSIATGADTEMSDVDVLVIGGASAPDLAAYLADLEHLMARPVNTIAMTTDAYAAGLAETSGFVRRVVDRRRLLIGVGDGWLRRIETDARRAA